MNEKFVRNWSKTLEAYAVKYGDKVNGWWVDGCYDEWFGYTEEFLHPYYEAVKKGNPNAAVTFNNGTKPWLYRYYPLEDFTSGEHENLNVVPESRFFEGVQSHILIPIGAGDSGIGCTWGSSGLGFTKEALADYVSRVTSVGGVVTLDCMLNRDGSFDPAQVEALRYIGERVNK
jgi:alpha-L-fucosidase